MFFNVVLLLTLAAVVRASVLTTNNNVYEAKDLNYRLKSARESKSYSVDYCNFQECDQLCRRLGVPSGACVGDSCYCNFKDKNTEVVFGFLDYFLRSTRYVEPTRHSRGCQSCNNLCRSFGFLKGLCSDKKDECSCSSTEEDTENITPSAKVAFCNPSACNTECRQLGYNGGFCLFFTCFCYK